MSNLRKFIKHSYKAVLVAANLDVKKIEIGRPHPTMLNDGPIVLIYNGDEDVAIMSGSEYVPTQYKKTFQFVVDAITPASPEGDDWLDDISGQIEFAMMADIFLENITQRDQDAIHGLKLVRTRPYNIEDESEHTWWGTSLIFETAYDQNAYPDKKPVYLEEYDVKINKQGYDENTTDPTLIEAEGSTT